MRKEWGTVSMFYDIIKIIVMKIYLVFRAWEAVKVLSTIMLLSFGAHLDQ